MEPNAEIIRLIIPVIIIYTRMNHIIPQSTRGFIQLSIPYLITVTLSYEFDMSFKTYLFIYS